MSERRIWRKVLKLFFVGKKWEAEKYIYIGGLKNADELAILTFLIYYIFIFIIIIFLGNMLNLEKFDQ